ncbi:CD3337/EF1877 family mobilome membrane protein [Bacillus pseudomycoides]|uniref:CD3337/EF1877 family mobilome membrane protein n=1 Tax=Bacillus pseudomycoides TaxID=64104 RepID=UPI003CEB9707
MKRLFVYFSLVFVLLVCFVPRTAFAEDAEVKPKIVKEGDTVREAEKYDSEQYNLMTYINEKWYMNTNEMLEQWKTAIKDAFWSLNVLIAKLGALIAYNLFSLDIINLMKDAVASIMSSTAKAITEGLLLAFFTLSGGYIVIRAYVKQDWGEFTRIFMRVFLSMVLLFTLLTNASKYITFANEASNYLEGIALQINPTLSGTSSSENTTSSGVIKSTKELGAILENKVFDAMLFKPFLLLNYNTTNVKAITKEDENRITNYLNTSATKEDGVKKRKDIITNEFEKLENKTINATNAPAQIGFIVINTFANIGIVVLLFMLALLRIVLQVALIAMLIVFAVVLLASVFPTFENLTTNFLKSFFIIIGYKGFSIFVVIVAIAFVTIGFEMTSNSNNIYFNIFINLLMMAALLVVWFKRQLLVAAATGAHHRIIDGSERMTNRLSKGVANAAKNLGENTLAKEKEKAASKAEQGKKQLKSIGKLANFAASKFRSGNSNNVKDANINAENAHVSTGNDDESKSSKELAQGAIEGSNKRGIGALGNKTKSAQGNVIDLGKGNKSSLANGSNKRGVAQQGLSAVSNTSRMAQGAVEGGNPPQIAQQDLTAVGSTSRMAQGAAVGSAVGAATSRTMSGRNNAATRAASRVSTTGARPAVTQQASRPVGRTVAASRVSTTGARPAVTQQASRPVGRTVAASRVSTTGARPAVTQQASRPVGRTVAASRVSTTGARPAVTQQASRPVGRTVAASRVSTTGARPAVTQQASRPVGRTVAVSRVSTTGARPAVTQQVSRSTGRNNAATRAASRISTTGAKSTVTQVSRPVGKIVSTPRMNDARIQKPAVLNRTIASQSQQINIKGGIKVNDQRKNQVTDSVISRPSILSRNENNSVNSVSTMNNSTQKRGDKK